MNSSRLIIILYIFIESVNITYDCRRLSRTNETVHKGEHVSLKISSFFYLLRYATLVDTFDSNRHLSFFLFFFFFVFFVLLRRKWNQPMLALPRFFLPMYSKKKKKIGNAHRHREMNQLYG
jgi:hypothetical protein